MLLLNHAMQQKVNRDDDNGISIIDILSRTTVSQDVQT